MPVTLTLRSIAALLAALVAALVAALPAAASAANWVVCDVRIKVTGHRNDAVQATVLNVVAQGRAGCALRAGQRLNFVAESLDYQRTLPRRQWPKRGRIAWLRYRHLDGICKNGGHPAPCRIEHYSLLKK
ncbi:MAG: hypothetical protein LBE78_03635 [Burkholderiaceae bacterium]|nr:hypothetical protein [Burkholderiaceae bacterium]